MSLDIHVMPLKKFWAGEYTTAAERFATKSGVEMSRIGQPKALYEPAEAEQLARGVRIFIERQTGTKNAWADDGDIMFSEQFQFEALHAVKAYAAHLETSDLPFETEDNFANQPALRRIYEGAPTDFPHLIHHEDNAGFYVPTDFAKPSNLAGGPPTIGSSIQLMMELARLRRSLGTFPIYSELSSGVPLDEPHPGLFWTKYGVAFLYHACWISVQSRLPIAIDG